MRPRTDDEILEDLKDWPVRNIYVERGVRLIEQLRQRVAEFVEQSNLKDETIDRLQDELIALQGGNEIEKLRQRVAELDKERDRLSELCDKWNFECDDMREDNNRLANVADALKQQRDELLAAAEAIEIDAEECLDFDDCSAMLVSIDAYHKLIEAIASINEK